MFLQKLPGATLPTNSTCDNIRALSRQGMELHCHAEWDVRTLRKKTMQEQRLSQPVLLKVIREAYLYTTQFGK